MLQKKITIRLKNGLQARPAALFVQQANRFHAHLTLEKDGKIANVKSIMGVMSIAPACGDQFLLRADGPDEREAIETLGTFVEDDQ
ncbi:HPr family phosphocarrier protein [Sporolactobacillus spathodeae]|uniref:Phosphotransferase system HPr (HPr) family protein n=1 Tax=Sporolactobacillus spathodeae TaxID=1465502 RepID=A0ABS2Q605_9BACL|nr:HPr family phosphocarrier protein [Sporolactobacillus spathodeae]MBM7657198.1 phosphotransferase system HPr (HPr) family protein [Sporolactobacillus spathodeae]